MTYKPITKTGLFFGGYHSTTQTLSNNTQNSWNSSNIILPFDTIIDNATNVSNEIILATNTKALAVGDISTTNTGGQSYIPIFTYTFSNSKYSRTSFHNRNNYMHGCDSADAFFTGSTQLKIDAQFQNGTTRNLPNNDFFAGFFI
tara:strand:- start:1587 stop:2021 length:435 start_codon:yes stop_codon:yes gene_type:complete